MVEETPLHAVRGLPWSKRVRVVDAKLIWPTVEELEARMQVRVSNDFRSTLKYDLSEHLNLAFETNDLVVSWDLSGEETRGLLPGYYDMIISDPGPTDARAIRVLHGPLTLDQTVTI